MGQLIEKKIDIIRSYYDPNSTPIPDYDYDEIFPVSVFSAIKKTENSNAPSLVEELEHIYELIDGKQDTIGGGISGRLMAWTGEEGTIGEVEILKNMSDDPASRSANKVPSEKAVGLMLDLKADQSSFNRHAMDQNIHITEEERSAWSQMTPLETFNSHIEDANSHVTAEDKESWNAKADQSDFQNHIDDTNNPHNVTAHQVGTYSRSEVDNMFASIRASFFNYKNIKYDERTGIAELVEYDADYWNPNYVLAYSDTLPEVTDESLIYFALKPVTDYATNESSDVIIYRKEPGSDWAEVGTHSMEPGDLVIRYPDTTMCAWVNGRFLKILSGSSADDGGESGTPAMWRPVVSADGVLGWTLSYETAPPDVVNIQGPAGYTPQKGIDYFDGASGLGVPSGGNVGDVLVKSSNEDYDSEWKSMEEAIGELIDDEGHLAISVKWDSVTEKPEIHNDLGDDEDGLITQKAVTDAIGSTNETVTELQEIIVGSGGVGGLQESLETHLQDFNNPHHVTPAGIGAVTEEAFAGHSTNTDNPHHVSAAQVGLGNVNNTSDLNKPISRAQQEALDIINEHITELNEIIGDGNLISRVDFDEQTCTLQFIFRNGEVMPVTIPIFEIFESMGFDEETKEFVFVLPNGTEKRIPITSLITDYDGSVSKNITVEVTGDIISAIINPDTVDGEDLVSSINLRGEPTTTTQPVANKSRKIATTEYVKNQVIDNVDSSDADRPLSANMGKWLARNKTSVDDVLQMIAETPMANVVDYLDSTDSYAALSANMGHELNLTKAPWVHTSPSGSTFGRATVDLFGHARAATTDPLMDGEVEIGTDDGYFARADHRHPTDTSRAPIEFGENDKLTGSPKTVTPSADATGDEIPNCEWVLAHGGGTGDVAHDDFHTYTTEEINTIVTDAYDSIINPVEP